jgi:glycosyltransferase involved in cell wall biosynthesis
MHYKQKTPTFSIITVTFNSESTISQTIQSILMQTFQNFEYIIIDGKSNDKTLEIVNSFRDEFVSKKIKLRVFSELDDGIYDGMNKGIKLSKGKIISILNSDDLYFDDNILKLVYEEFNKDKLVSILYGNLVYFSNSPDRFNRFWVTRPNSFLNGWNPPHPSTFVKKSVYSNFGLFNPDLYISSDYDFLLRVMYLNNVKSYHLDKFLVKMRQGGRSTKSIKNILIGWKEIYNILKTNLVKWPLLVLIKRISSKIIYKFKWKKYL